MLVLNDQVGPEFCAFGCFFGVSGAGNDRRPDSFGHLDDGRPYSAAASVDKNGFARAQAEQCRTNPRCAVMPTRAMAAASSDLTPDGVG